MAFLESKNLMLTSFSQDLISSEYISWLNDPEVNLYSQRSMHPTSEAEAREYVRNISPQEKILAMIDRDKMKHIGNIKYGPIDWVNRRADISIVLGNKDYWGKGMASEAIYSVSKHLFENLNLERLEAGSFNPAFIAAVLKNLGWKIEGVQRKRIFLRGQYHDYTLMSLLKDEFKRLSRYEK
jgi:[ribosomal protein S5]-alanine N-acetyltransferase